MATPNRPLIIGPDEGPEPPYPLRMSGLVISGFGRGSKDLGIPTANLPVDDAQTPWISSTPSGVYFGWASLRLPPTHPDYIPTPTTTTTTTTDSPPSPDHRSDDDPAAPARGANGYAVYPMVMSIGYNPFYRNRARSAEVHVLRRFAADFYGADMRLLVLGFVREERDYAGLDALVADINFDCAVARRSLARPGWAPRGVDVEVGDVDVDGDDGDRVGEGKGLVNGVDVDGVEGKGNDDGQGGERRKRFMRGTLDCGWLIRPSEDDGKTEGN